MVMERVTYLLGLQGSGLSLESPRISAEIVKSGNGQTLSRAQACSSLEKENTIAIRMVGTYRPAIFSFFAIPVTVESRAYLLANNQTFSTQTNPNPNGSCGGVSSGTYKDSPSPSVVLIPADGGAQIVQVPDGGGSRMELAISDLCTSSSSAEIITPVD